MKRLIVLSLLFALPCFTHAEDLSGTVKKAVERITLDQPGTKPFHLKASLEPSFARDKDSGRTGEVEIWWMSPTQWRRDVRCPQFHQVDVVNGSREWQKSDGTYFPEWLREIAVELIRPVPQLDVVLEHVKSGEARHLMGQINVDWVTSTGTAEVHNIHRSGVALRESTGELLYAYGFGWGGDFKDFEKFHDRLVAHKVSWGSPEVTAKVTILEELNETSEELFDANTPGADSQPLRTELLDETRLRRNLLPEESAPWPPLQDGPLEGNVTSEILVDREGSVREIGTVVSENPAIADAGRERLLAMRFKPFLQNGIPVQAYAQITLPFKTTRPAGTETFESAKTFFERGRKLSFLAAGGSTPYLLTASFVARGAQGGQDNGEYKDTWQDSSHWRREATFSKSRYLRTQNGDKRYELADGPDVPLLRLMFETLEPIPAIDTFVESDWRIKRDKVDGQDAIRVLAGYESPEGKLDPDQARGYWFDNSGHLLRIYRHGLQTTWSQFEEYSGLNIGRRIDLLRDGKLAARIEILGVAPPGDEPNDFFEER